MRSQFHISALQRAQSANALGLLALLVLLLLPAAAGAQAIEATQSAVPGPGFVRITPIERALKPAGVFLGDLRTISVDAVVRDEYENTEREPPLGPPIILPYVGPPEREGPPVVRAPMPVPSSSFEGMNFNINGAGFPPDTVGDVGPNHFIQGVNSWVTIYRKSDGASLVSLSLNNFMSPGAFGNDCDNQNRGDPVVLYDTFEDRWVVTGFAFTSNANGVNNPPGVLQCFAVSRSGDPVSGGWNYYFINTTGGFGDYGKFSIWPDGIYGMVNLFGYLNTAGFLNVRAYAFNKMQMYAGEPNVQILEINLPSNEFTILPANARLQSGAPPAGAPNYFVSNWNSTNSMRVYKFAVDWNRIGNSSFTGPFTSVSPTSWSTAPGTVPAQGGNNNDTLTPRLMMQNQYSNIGGVESLWNSHTVAGANAAATSRFYQLNVTGGNVAAATTQAFNHDPNSLNRYMPSVAVDRAGNMAIGYSTSSASARPAIQYAGRLAGDPVNSLPQTETLLVQGAGAQTAAGGGGPITRWGDYAALSLDPDGCRFWLTSQYYQVNGSNWNTRFGSFAFPPADCTPVSNGTLQGTVTALVGGAPIAGASVTLGSRSTTTDGSGSYSFAALPPGIYPTEIASAGGFISGSQNDVSVPSGGSATQNFALATQAATACLVDTTQSDFQTGVGSNIDSAISPGSLRATASDGIDQQNTNLIGNGNGTNTTTWFAQTFTAGSTGLLTRVDFNVFCFNCPGTAPNYTVRIRPTIAGAPATAGPELASVTVPGSTSGASGFLSATFPVPANLVNGTTYAIVINASTAPGAGGIAAITRSGSDVYAGGARYFSNTSGNPWSLTGFDLGFRTYMQSGFAPIASQISGAKNSNPTPGLVPNWTTLSWSGSTPAGTTLRFQAAASENPNGPFDFVGPDGTNATFFTSSGADISQFNGFRYMKYQALLETSNTANSAQLDDVTLCHENLATGPAASGGLQVGRVTLNAMINGTNRLTRVNFAQPFVLAPVVIVQPSNENTDPASLRIVNVTRASFEVLQVEAPGCVGCTGLSSAASIDWLAASEGSYRLRRDTMAFGRQNRGFGPGPLLKVGRVQSNRHQRGGVGAFTGWPATNWQAVTFPGGENFIAAPVILTSIQSWDNEGPNFVGPQPGLLNASQNFETTVMQNITVSGFDVALEVSEVDDDDAGAPGIDNAETIGYVAIEGGVSVDLVPLGGGNIGLATGTGTANDTCGSTVLAGLSFPSAPSAASLRGFAGKQSRNDADGGWLRRCAMTTPGGNAVSMTIDVDEDQDGDVERTHVANEAIGAAIFGNDFITSPVTLAFAQSQPVGNGVEFSFSVSSEVGALGYRLWGRVSEAADWELLSAALIPAENADGMVARSYQRRIERADLRQIRVEDIDIFGHSRFHAPIEISSSRSHSVGSMPEQPALDWSAIRTSNRAANVRNLPNSGAFSALISVSQAGPQRVSYEQLAALGLTSGQAADRFALSDGGRQVARAIVCNGAQGQSFGPGCTLEFLGVLRDSLYGSDNVYQLQLVDAQASGSVLRASRGNFDPSNGATLGIGVSERLLTRQVGYSFSAPGPDPWFDTRLLATAAPVEHHVDWTVPHYAGGSVQIALRLWGGLDFAEDGDDHSVEIVLNDQVLETRRFDGLVAEEFYFEVPQSAVGDNNRLTVRLLMDTGFSADLIYLDELRLSYAQFNRTQDGQLRLGDFSPTLATSEFLQRSGFESASLGIAGVQAQSVLWSEREGVLYRDVTAQDGAVFAGTHALWMQPLSQVAVPEVRAEVPAIAEGRPIQYLIVTAPEFESELTGLIALQQSRGYQVEVLRTDQIYARYSDFEASPQAIAQAIRSRTPQFVLLVGGDSYDYHNYLGLGAQSLVPTFYRAADAIVRFAASDADFADYDRDGSPELALGRIPARTLPELQRALTSILERAAAAPERYFATSGKSSAGERFAAHSRSLLSHLRQGQPVEYALIDEVGLDAARSSTRSALGGSADWINYAGHSSPNRWAFESLLTSQDLGSIQRVGAASIVSQWGCWNNYFVLPNQNTMAHALMFDSNRLAAAVIGSSSLAEDASHMALAVRFFDLVEDGRFDERPMRLVNTLGEALMQAKREVAREAPEHLGSNYSILLFGDPAQPLR